MCKQRDSSCVNKGTTHMCERTKGPNARTWSISFRPKRLLVDRMPARRRWGSQLWCWTDREGCGGCMYRWRLACMDRYVCVAVIQHCRWGDGRGGCRGRSYWYSCWCCWYSKGRLSRLMDCGRRARGGRRCRRLVGRLEGVLGVKECHRRERDCCTGCYRRCLVRRRGAM